MRKLVLPVVTAVAIGAAGLATIKTFEGVRYTPYRDVVGVVTVCYGHTGNDIVWGRRYTEAECDRLLQADIAKHSVVITPNHPRNCIGNRRLTPNQRDAVISFTFNVGTGNFCGSTMAKHLTAGRTAAAAAQFPRWNKAGGKVFAGLSRRRAAEQSLFLSNHRPEARDTLSGRATALLMDLS